MNLLKETLDIITNSRHTTNDIIFIGSEYSGHRCSWEEFTVLANFEYDDRRGGVVIATDLMIVFSDGSFMVRREYDDKEWWEYNIPFKMPEESHKISRLKSDKLHHWVDLSQLNKVKNG